MSTGHRRRFSPRVLPELHPVCAKKNAPQCQSENWAWEVLLDYFAFFLSFFFSVGIVSGPKDAGKLVLVHVGA